MPEAALHVGSGKVRELYALDDERLLLVASDRISTFDVVLPTEIPDKGRVLTGLSALLVRAHAGHLREPPARAAPRRPLDRMPAARDAADRVRRARLPLRLRLEGLQGDRRGLRPPAADGLIESAAAAGADLHARDEGDDRPRREHRPRTGCRARRRRASRRGRARVDRALRASRPSTRAARGILIADTKFEFGLDEDGQARARRRGADAGLVPLLAGRRVPARRLAAVVRQAVRARLLRVDSAGTRPIPGPSSPTTSSTGRAHATSRRSSASPASRFDAYLADPEVVLT